MDLTQIQHLDDQQKERYMALSRVFELPGWAHIKEWATKSYEDARERGSAAQTWENNRIAFGERIVYDIVRQLDEIMEREFTVIADQNAQKETEGNEDNFIE